MSLELVMFFSFPFCGLYLKVGANITVEEHDTLDIDAIFLHCKKVFLMKENPPMTSKATIWDSDNH